MEDLPVNYKTLLLAISATMLLYFIINYNNKKKNGIIKLQKEEVASEETIAVPLEEQLIKLEELGLKLNYEAGITKDDLLNVYDLSLYVENPYSFLVTAMGVTIEQEPWTPLSNSVYSFDTECIEDNGSYVEVLENIIRISNGDLKLSQLKDNIEHGIAKEEGPPEEEGHAFVSFNFEAKEYKFELEYHYDWFDTDLFSKINSLLDQSNVNKRIYRYDTGDQTEIILWLNEKQVINFKNLTGIQFQRA